LAQGAVLCVVGTGGMQHDVLVRGAFECTRKQTKPTYTPSKAIHGIQACINSYSNINYYGLTI
jgi:hypothetical protein